MIKNYIVRFAANRLMLVKCALLSAMLLALTACPAPGPSCVYADDFGQNVSLTLPIDVNKKWAGSGIKVGAGEPLNMEVLGSVDICPIKVSLGRSMIDPRRKAWQKSGAVTGVILDKNEFFNIEIKDNYSNGDTAFTGGVGLYAFIAEFKYDAAGLAAYGQDGIDADNGKPYYFGDGIGGHFQPNNGSDTYIAGLQGRNLKSAYSHPYVFELYNNGSSGPGAAGFSGASPVKGMLFFKYANHPEYYPPDTDYGEWETLWSRDRTCSFNVFGCWNEYWTGPDYGGHSANGYDITISNGCGGKYGKFLEAVIIPDPDNQVVQLQYPRYLPLVEGKSCVPTWYSERCVPRIVSTPSGCDPQKTSPEDPCTQSLVWETDGVVGGGTCPARNMATDTGCVMDTVDVPIAGGTTTSIYSVDPSYYISGAGSVYNLDPATGVTNSYGKYRGTVLANGELWFRFKDDANKSERPGDGLPTYTDNDGYYKVKIFTTKVESGFSRFVNMLIDPVKDRLFGSGDSNFHIHDPMATCLAYPSPPRAIPDVTDPCNPMHTDTSNPNYHSSTLAHIPPSNGIAKGMFMGLTGNMAYTNALRAVLSLYIIIYGFLYLLGMVRDHRDEAMKRLLKFAIIQQLLSPTSWEFFNTYMFTGFMDGIDDLVGRFSGSITGSANLVDLSADPLTGQTLTDPATGSTVNYNSGDPFAFANQTLARFFSGETMIKIFGLLFASPIGWLYILLIGYGMYTYILAILKAILIYLMALLALSMLIALAPLFIAFTLFERTKGFFGVWFRQMINFLLQPVMVLTGLAIFNIFVYSALYTLLHYDVCWQTVISVDIDTYVFGHIKFDLFNFYLPAGTKNYDIGGGAAALGGLGSESSVRALPMQFFVILVFIIICNTMMKMNDWMGKIAAQITTGNIGTSLAHTVFGQGGALAGAMASLAQYPAAVASVGNFVGKAGKAVRDKIKSASEGASPKPGDVEGGPGSAAAGEASEGSDAGAGEEK